MPLATTSTRIPTSGSRSREQKSRGSDLSNGNQIWLLIAGGDVCCGCLSIPLRGSGTSVASLTAIFMQVISERDTKHNVATHSPNRAWANGL
jgi:hypothetical protein